jgi:hypothetical protein
MTLFGMPKFFAQFFTKQHCWVDKVEDCKMLSFPGELGTLCDPKKQPVSIATINLCLMHATTTRAPFDF